MQIKNYGHFQQYQDGWMYLYKNEDGRDWNAIQRGDLENPPIVALGPQGQFVASIYPTWVSIDANGTVTNVEFDPSRIVPHDKTVLGTDAAEGVIQIGMIYADGAFAFPPPPTAEQARDQMSPISRRQLRLTLVRNGVTLESVAAAIEAMPEGAERDEARIEWEDGVTYERLNPRLLTIGEALGLTAEQIDAMWEEAVKA